MERWEEIAEELDSYDLECIGYEGQDLILSKRTTYGNHDFYCAGAWTDTEKACKRIAELEEKLEASEALATLYSEEIDIYRDELAKAEKHLKALGAVEEEQ